MSSPALASQQLLDFFNALKMVYAGRRVTRLAWNNEEIYCILRNDILCLRKPDNTVFIWQVSIGDMEAQDWYTLG